MISKLQGLVGALLPLSPTRSTLTYPLYQLPAKEGGTN